MASHEDQPRPLKVSVVGAGPGGLATALALRRKGHHVNIFEASPIKTEIGAGVGIQFNALRVLHVLGFSRGSLRGTDFDGGVVFDGRTGDGTPRPWHVSRSHEPELHDVFCHRSDLADELLRLAIGEGEGPPVQLHLGRKTVSCDPDAGTITLHDGEIVNADVVIGADGIHSVVRTSIFGHPIKATASGWSCFRCLFDASNLNEVHELDWVRDGLPGGRVVVSRGGGPFRLFFIYPIQDGAVMNFVAFFTDPDQDTADWVPTARRADIREKFHDFHPKFLRILDLPPAGPILKWQLRTMPLLPTWIRGHAALLGDAAHATLPLLGQGAGVAIEEAGALGALLPLGTMREEVPARLQAYQILRKERGDFINMESVAEAADPEKRGLYLRSREIQATLFEHDAIKIAEEYLATHSSMVTG
ncbi:FAD/NAD(P)-binding domain-containing protein [Mycena maculata]|uniref:FAD/NAD(P)-binding domain-containing protein n=1 Tax=Mycena maculata TaxID=230809 RepID=A0AAD7J8G0_9AGAR|nr:FAD/NAD(P)-binding domain-containing protein [Mycena maculata]